MGSLPSQPLESSTRLYLAVSSLSPPPWASMDSLPLASRTPFSFGYHGFFVALLRLVPFWMPFPFLYSPAPQVTPSSQRVKLYPHTDKSRVSVPAQACPFESQAKASIADASLNILMRMKDCALKFTSSPLSPGSDLLSPNLVLVFTSAWHVPRSYWGTLQVTTFHFNLPCSLGRSPKAPTPSLPLLSQLASGRRNITVQDLRVTLI